MKLWCIITVVNLKKKEKLEKLNFYADIDWIWKQHVEYSYMDVERILDDFFNISTQLCDLLV